MLTPILFVMLSKAKHLSLTPEILHILLFAALIENLFNYYIKEWSG